uniref:G-protein coupled receptor n=1 Tax=Parascaris univalens TaxID=6257 RepID=A0A915BFR3_PARUN
MFYRAGIQKVKSSYEGYVSFILLPQMTYLLTVVLFSIDGLLARHPGCFTHTDHDGFDVVNCSHQRFQRILPRARLHTSQFELMPNAISSRTRSLNLSNNEFISLNSSSFASLRRPEILESLDLSNNKLIFIAPAAFKSLTRLKYLNLSGNRLHTVNRSSFTELDSLEVLNLDGNPLSSFPDRTFSPLLHLKQISIQSDQLACDCQLVDLLKFINKENSVNVTDRTVCIFPITLRGEKLATLQAKSMKKACGRGDFEPSIFELEPSSASLIVYPGEEQQIACMISNIGNISMEWLKNNVPVSSTSRLEITHSSNTNIRSLTLTFKPVEWEDEGDWICYAEFREASLRNTIRLMPISVNTEHCVQEWKADEKGEIVWPISKQGTVSAICPHGPLNAVAYRVCRQGKWSEVDSGSCAFSSALTKSLFHTLSHMHSSKLLDELIDSMPLAYELSPYETRLIGWIIGNASESDANQELTAIAFALRSKYATTELDGEMLRNRLQSIALNDQIMRLKNMAACELMLLSTSLDEEAHKVGFISAYTNGQYTCHRQRNVELLAANGMTSMRIPWQTLDLFPSVTVLNVFWFANTHLFATSYTLDGRWVALNQVHAIVLKRTNLKPVQAVEKASDILNTDGPSAILFTYFLRIPTEQVRLGVWNDGEWRIADGNECTQRRAGPRYVIIACSRAFIISHLGENLTFFTAMQNASLIDELTTVKKGIELPWWTYMSSGFLSFSMVFVVFSNICCIRRKHVLYCKSLHVLINLCVSIFSLCVAFTLGVNKVFDESICILDGALIHFSFLAAFYWIMLAVRTTQRKIGKVASSKEQRVAEDEFSEPEFENVAPHGPIAGLYFLAYGVPFFSVSFSVAIDASSYTSSTHSCFPPTTFQSKVFQCGVLLPFMLSLLFTIIFYTVGKCRVEYLRRLFESRCLSDTPRTENPSAPLVGDAELKLLDTSLPDDDMTARHQMNGFITTALLLLGACCVAVIYVRVALATTDSAAIPVAVSILHSILCCALAIFIFYMHSVRRFQLLWQKNRMRMLLNCSAPTQNDRSPLVRGVRTIVDADILCVPRPAPQSCTTNANALPPTQQNPIVHHTYHGNDGLRMHGALGTGKLRERAMQRAARKYYQCKRQFARHSSTLSTVQGTTIEEESGGIVSNDFFEASESINEDFTSSSGLDLLHVEMDRLSEKHKEMASMSSASTQSRRICYAQV